MIHFLLISIILIVLGFIVELIPIGHIWQILISGILATAAIEILQLRLFDYNFSTNI